MNRSVLNWTEVDQNGLNGSKQTDVDRNRPKQTEIYWMDRTVQNGQKWTEQSKMDQIGPKQTKGNQIGLNNLKQTEMDQMDYIPDR